MRQELLKKPPYQWLNSWWKRKIPASEGIHMCFAENSRAKLPQHTSIQEALEEHLERRGGHLGEAMRNAASRAAMESHAWRPWFLELDTKRPKALCVIWRVKGRYHHCVQRHQTLVAKQGDIVFTPPPIIMVDNGP